MAKGSTGLRQSKSIHTLPLETVITQLRAGLLQSAVDRPKNFKPMFEVVEATVELGVSFQRNVRADGKIKVLVVEVGVDGSETSTATHRIALKLMPLPRGFTMSEKDTDDPRYQGAGKQKTKGS